MNTPYPGAGGIETERRSWRLNAILLFVGALALGPLVWVYTSPARETDPVPIEIQRYEPEFDGPFHPMAGLPPPGLATGCRNNNANDAVRCGLVADLMRRSPMQMDPFFHSFKLRPCAASRQRDGCIESPSGKHLFPRSRTGRWAYLIETPGQSVIRSGFKTRRSCEHDLAEDIRDSDESLYGGSSRSRAECFRN